MNNDANKQPVYEPEVLTGNEEYILSQCKKVKLATYMCMFFGIYGVDKFIMGCKKAALEVLFTTLFLIVSIIIGIVIFLIPIIGQIISIIIFTCCVFSLFVRSLYYFIQGIRMLSIEPKIVVMRYEVYKNRERAN